MDSYTTLMYFPPPLLYIHINVLLRKVDTSLNLILTTDNWDDKEDW